MLLLFLAGLTIRVGVSIGLDLTAWVVEGGRPVQEGSFDHTRRFVKAPDSDDYSERAYAIAQIAHGNKDPVLRFALANPYGKPAHLHGLGAFYYLFGFSPFAVKWVHGLLGALMGPLIFLIGIRCVPAAAAKMAAAAVAFFPSLVLWSATNLKDTPFGFLAAGAVLLFFQAVETRGVVRRLLYAGAAVAVLSILARLREPYSPILLGVVALMTLAVWMTCRYRRKALPAVALGLAALTGLAFHKALPYALVRHVQYLGSEAGDGYRFLPDRFYTASGRAGLLKGKLDASLGQVASWTARSVLHYWAEPFPWKIQEGIRLVVYPQMVFWYLLTPLCVWGIWISLRTSPAALLPALLLAAWTCMGALTSGNVGTVFRFRDIITPWALLFASAGFWSLLERPVGEDTR